MKSTMKPLRWACSIIIMSVVLMACTKQELVDEPHTVASGKQKLMLSQQGFVDGDVVGKVTVGYQGWFTAEGDGSPDNYWSHWNWESWPDVREYTATYSTTLNLVNGQPAKMFSSWDQSTVNKHFEWMQNYDIDCAALQRFCNEIGPGTPKKAFRDGIAIRVKNASETYGRKFYIAYDASGWGDIEAIKADWTNTITGNLNLLASPAYARQNGKPVVSIYGLGYTEHPATVAKALEIINWFKSQGLYVIGFIPGQWRAGTGDSKAGFMDAYKAFDMISAWAVGRIADSYYEPWITGDRDFCIANGIDYQPCIYPGTSFYNSNGTPKNLFPRNHGDFLWTQFATVKNAGVKSVYVAMFDEINEGTQIFKTAENASQAPTSPWFLTLDADNVPVSSDFYLRLTQDGGKMLKGQIPYSASHPTQHFLGDVAPLKSGTYKIINRSSGLALDARAQLTTNGTPIQQWAFNGGENQRWIVTDIGNGQYSIVGKQSKRSLDVTAQLTDDGTKIELWDINGGPNQSWIISASTNGFYTVKSVQSNKLMEVPSSKIPIPQALVQISSPSATGNQEWSFTAL